MDYNDCATLWTDKERMPKRDKPLPAKQVLDEFAVQAIATAIKPQPLDAGRKAAMRERLCAHIEPPAPAATRSRYHALDAGLSVGGCENTLP